ncbi:hypothetical protein [Chryseobacterium culicis]|uniref:hypothetical protein n=1 Tax=Chryseobacterium culicis TaxID=680127 RepID=UPI001874C252|nr:hypothetical protein [Chryseobacterium culicis]MBE4948973.1 hypothetical protein [Chryseobacterium culicis]
MSKNKTQPKAIITLAYDGFTNIHEMTEESRSKDRSIKKKAQSSVNIREIGG